MLIKDIINKKKEESFIYLEQNVNESFYANVPKKYHPFYSNSYFFVPYYNTNDKSEIFSLDLDKKKVKFFIHPLTLKKIMKLNRLPHPKGYYKAYSTSSIRTVFLDQPNPCMLKLDLEEKLGDSIKFLKREHIIHSQQISNEIKNLPIPNNLAFLPESLGVIFYINQTQYVTMLKREFKPFPSKNYSSFLIPFFSLFNKDRKKPNDKLILSQLIESKCNKNKKRLDFFIEKILSPYITTWSELLLNYGLSAEAHLQNTLLEVDEELNPRRIVLRDLQDFFIHPKIRASRGLHLDFNKNILGDKTKKYLVADRLITNLEEKMKISLSLTYDYRIAKSLDKFCEVLKEYDKNAENVLVNQTKNIINSFFKSKDLFPKEAYILDKIDLNGGYFLHFKKKSPKFRD